MMSDFSVSFAQRQRLLAGDYSALDFQTKPYGLEPGAVYVLAWQKATAVICDGMDPDDVEIIRTPRTPIWFLTVTKVVRHRLGFWRARFDVTDRRDPDFYLASGSSDYTMSRRFAVDDLPVAPSDEVRRKAISEFDHQRRLARHAEERRERGRERSRARRKRAA